MNKELREGLGRVVKPLALGVVFIAGMVVNDRCSTEEASDPYNLNSARNRGSQCDYVPNIRNTGRNAVVCIAPNGRIVAEEVGIFSPATPRSVPTR